MIPYSISERLSPNHASRGQPPRIDMLVLHYTGMQSAEAALNRLCDPAARVSAHYVVEEDGAIWQLVREARRAFHAGRSCWEGEHDLNSVSIGIEIVNPGHEWGYRAFPAEQMAAVEYLCRDILSRHPIPPHRVVGHSDIAPDRKTDPGEAFDWSRLARAGIGIWPEPSRRRPDAVLDHPQAVANLGLIGYCVAPVIEEAIVAAFQRRFRPTRVDGVIDTETAARLADVQAAFMQSRTTWSAGRSARNSCVDRETNAERGSIEP
jgi:N-acetylmuramoyl-L-alanine amidase